jgi:PAS domain S-box-containing protein
MKEDRTGSSCKDGLRQRAAECLKSTEAAIGAYDQGADTQRLLQELQIHQIELEMQNQELLCSRRELETSQMRYSNLYDLAPVGYVTLSEASSLILEVNITAATLLGVVRSDLVKNRFTSFILSEDQAIYDHHCKLLFETGAPQVCELRLIKKDASPFWVRIDATLGKETDGAPICRATMIDITNRKQMDAVRDFLAKYSGPVHDDRFFSLLAQYLAKILGMDFICIDRLEGDGLTAQTVAVWCDGKFEDNISYSLKDTPCGEVVGKAVCCFPANVCQFFPRDQVLQDLRADSYVGVTLWGHTGRPIGLIAVIGRSPLSNRLLAEDILRLVAVRAAGEMERLDAEKQLRESLVQVRRAVETTIQVLLMAVEIKDPYTAGHQRRVTSLTRSIATEMGLPPEKIEGLRMSGIIHDIGKITLPTEILSKPSKLSSIELSLIKAHVQLGYDILKDIESPWPLAEIVFQHHERMDGSGYPRNLKGEEILIEARIIGVSDVVEAMTSHRPYRAALGIDAALDEIEKNAGILYDNTVVDACLKLFREKGYTLERNGYKQ